MMQNARNTNPGGLLNKDLSPLGTGAGKRKPSHQVMQELSESMLKQNRTLVREFQKVSSELESMSKSTKTNTMTSERIHDRLDSLIVEQRTTNILLSQLVSMHNSVMSEDPIERLDRKEFAESTRLNAYNRVLRGE